MASGGICPRFTRRTARAAASRSSRPWTSWRATGRPPGTGKHGLHRDRLDRPRETSISRVSAVSTSSPAASASSRDSHLAADERGDPGFVQRVPFTVNESNAKLWSNTVRASAFAWAPTITTALTLGLRPVDMTIGFGTESGSPRHPAGPPTSTFRERVPP